jgi:hypothetical protein
MSIFSIIHVAYWIHLIYPLLSLKKEIVLCWVGILRLPIWFHKFQVIRLISTDNKTITMTLLLMRVRLAEIGSSEYGLLGSQYLRWAFWCGLSSNRIFQVLSQRWRILGVTSFILDGRKAMLSEVCVIVEIRVRVGARIGLVTSGTFRTLSTFAERLIFLFQGW